MRRLSAAERALLIALALWGLGPLALIILHALGSSQRLTGADGIIGGDQLQYLAWVRDSGSNGLASNLFTLAPSAHVFLQPMFALSGLLWRIGAPLALAYLLWKPVAIVVLFAGAVLWSSRLLEGDGLGRAGAVALCVFFFTPLAALAGWATLGSLGSRTSLLSVAGELFPAGELWGYMPSAIAIGLMPVAVLAIERRAWATATATALIISWLHPWQGAILELILVGLAVWSWRRDQRPLAALAPLAAPALGAALPLGYYLALSHFDSSWQLAAHNELAPHLPLWALLVGLGPLVAVAAVGLRRPPAAVAERTLLLWVPASLITYAVLQSYPAHALQSLSFPLAVLAVRGFKRLSRRTVLGVVAVAAATLPGIAYELKTFSDVAGSPLQRYYLTPSEGRALDWIAHDAPPGGLLARTLFALVIPAQTGRAVWVGHQFWSQDYVARRRVADVLFAGTLTSAAVARTAVLLSGVRLVASDCGTHVDLTPVLRPIVSSVHRFGCATVFVVKRPHGTR